MRRLMWLSIGFGSGCLIWIQWLWGSNVWIPMAVAAMTVVLSVLIGLRVKPVRIGAWVGLGLLLGLSWLLCFRQRYLVPLHPLDGSTVPMIITAEQYSKEGYYSPTVQGRVTVDGKRYTVTVYLREQVQIAPGDKLAGEFRIRLTDPDAARESVSQQGRGIYLTATQKDEITVIKAQKLHLYMVPGLAAERVRRGIMECFPQDAAPFALALFLGDTSQLSYETDTALKTAGVRHLAAVSGFHVAMLYAAVRFLCRKNRYLTPLLSAAVLTLFAGMAGFTPSVTRACLMLGIMSLGELTNREYDPPTALAAACLIMMVSNPFVIGSVSFQLSVAGVSGLMIAAEPVKEKLQSKFPQCRGIWRTAVNWFCSSVGVSVGSMLFTTPISVYYFGMVSIAGAAANLLIVWIVTAVFTGIALTVGSWLLFAPAGGVIAWVISWGIRYVLWITRLLAGIPYAAVYTQSSYILAWIVGCYALLAICLLCHRGYGLAVCAAAAGLCAALWLSSAVPARDDFRVTILDVGEGQSILLQSHGHAFLVDCGGQMDTAAADTVCSMLLSQGIRTLDGIVLTHYDWDHAGALPLVLRRIRCNMLLLPDVDDEGYLQNIAHRGIVFVDRMLQLPLGNGNLTVYPPDTRGSTNEKSMCVLFAAENCGILITGDRSRTGELRLLERWDPPQAQILVAGHHGSADSTSAELLEAISPEIVVISCGAGNLYGHPAQPVLERLEAFGCTVMRTDLMGNITIRSLQIKSQALNEENFKMSAT